MIDHAVVVVGGGPTGLMLAGELKLAGVDVAVVERRANQELDGPRARGLHARTIEVLDQRGIAERFLAEGQVAQVQSFGGIVLDISDFPTRRNYGLALPQKHFERLLRGWIDELDVRIYAECEATGFTQDETGVDLHLSGREALRAEYLVGCDGGRSVIRKAARIEFAGSAPSVSSLLAEVAMSQPPEFGIRRDDRGQHALGPADGGRVGLVVTEPYTGQSEHPTLQEVSDALISVWGTDFGVHSPSWMSRFTDLSLQARSYRRGRVLIAGDAAHVHYPVGGQGLNVGVQDAVNLGWKLAQVVRGTSPESLLDTYHAERHPVAARVLQYTMAASALIRSNDRIDALRGVLTELLRMDQPRKQMAGMLSGLDIRYDFGEGHPLLGRRMPDLDITTAEAPRRTFTLLHAARPLLLNFADPASIELTGWSDRVQRIDATCEDTWEIPVVGAVSPPSAVLVRPDGYVAWVGEGGASGLPNALNAWFGPAAAS